MPRPWLIEIVDNGEPGPGEDQHRYRMAMPNEVEGSCSDFGPLPPRETIARGNYIVHGG
jgi:hypothetical protein